MSTRFLDKSFLRDIGNGFTPRRRGMPIAWITLIFFLVFIILMGAIATRAPEQLLALGSISALLFIGLGVWIAKVVDDYQRALLLTEFQNALFAGAARQGNEFCVILKRDGSVAYVDPEFMRRFLPGTRQVLHMGALWNALNLDETDRLALSESVLEGRPEMRDILLATDIEERHPFSLSLAPIEIWNEREGERRLLLSIDPITRPSGYLLLRARRDVASHDAHRGRRRGHHGHGPRVGRHGRRRPRRAARERARRDAARARRHRGGRLRPGRHARLVNSSANFINSALSSFPSPSASKCMACSTIRSGFGGPMGPPGGS